MESAMFRPLFLALPAALAASACVAPTSYERTAPVAADAALAVEARSAAVAETVIVGEPTSPGTAPGRYRGPVQRGVVTAGDIDDGLNLPAFQRYVARSGDLGLPQLGFGTPVLAQLVGPSGNPAPGARYTLRQTGAADPFYTGYAGPDGRIIAFPQLLGAGNLRQVELRAFDDAGQGSFTQTLTSGRNETLQLPFDSSWTPGFLDLVLVVDTTGSMGDEIAFLNREMIGIVRTAARTAPGLDIRYGLVVYRDQGDDYVTQSYGFTTSAPTMAGWLRGLQAGGGGDEPEAAAAALQAGVNLDWRAGRGERIMLQVADAPPHNGDAATYLRAAKTAAERGVQIFTLGASGTSPAAEYMMRQAAVATNGRYLFLTDDSGVGSDHGEPTISCYRVTKLARLLTRILASELSGQRQEAGASEILRETGTYRGGQCLN
jgi:von Willebrand factor type A domain